MTQQELQPMENVVLSDADSPPDLPAPPPNVQKFKLEPRSDIDDIESPAAREWRRKRRRDSEE